MRSTYTYVILEVSPDTYDEIYNKLKKAQYDQSFHVDSGSVLIDMHGIALKRLPDYSEG